MISLQSDNRTVLSYLRNEGGTKSQSLMRLTHMIYHILQTYNLRLTLHLPGRYNIEADHLSRQSLRPEWHLLLMIPSGSCSAELCIDRCEGPPSNLHRCFLAPVELQVSMDISTTFLLPKVLAHLNNSSGIFLIVAPRWNKAFWRPDLKSRALAAPFTIYNLHQVIIDTATSKPPAKVQQLHLEVRKCGSGLKHLQTGHQINLNY